MPKDNPIALAAIILAAGASTRMGKPKLLLPWGETSIIGHLLTQWSVVGAKQITVVCAEDDKPMEAELDRLGFSRAGRIYNPLPARGMFSSIQCAARWPGWTEGITHLALVLGDQPHLRDDTLRTLIIFAATHSTDVCQPGQAGHRRHPVILPKPWFEKLADTTCADLKEFLKTCITALCEFEDPGLALDIDFPMDYEQALAYQKHVPRGT
jgi:molybdenum cofactor cytidylyltransferase